MRNADFGKGQRFSHRGNPAETGSLKVNEQWEADFGGASLWMWWRGEPGQGNPSERNRRQHATPGQDRHLVEMNALRRGPWVQQTFQKHKAHTVLCKSLRLAKKIIFKWSYILMWQLSHFKISPKDAPVFAETIQYSRVIWWLSRYHVMFS